MSNDLASQERVVGVEMEYCPTLTLADPNAFPHDPQYALIGAIHEIIHNRFTTIEHGFLENGFRVYRDGELLEVATPESHVGEIGVIQLASEQMVIDALGMYLQHHKKYFRPSKYDGYILPLRVSDGSLPSGYQENYQVLAGDTHRILPFLESHALARTAWTGQGEYDPISDSFAIAQKSSTKSRGTPEAIQVKGTEGNLRYEFRRANYPTLHWQLKHRVAFTSGVVRLAELGFIDSDFVFLANGVWLRKEASQSPYLSFKLRNGSEMSIIEYELELASILATVGAKYSFPDNEVIAAEEVYRVGEKINAREIEAVCKEVPWAMKQVVMARQVPEFIDDAYDCNSKERVKLRTACVALDSRGGAGLVDKMRASQAYPEFDEKLVMRAVDEPPCTEVAKQRAAAIRSTRYKVLPEGFFYSVDWMQSQLEIHAYAGPPELSLEA